MSAARIPVIGIVGGIGSGKSTVASALSQYLACCRLDADAAGHRALQNADVQQQLRSVFGDGIFNPSGEVSRSHVAALVFGDEPAQRQARRQLEQIVHPHIRAELLERLNEARRQQECDIVLLDAALLLEAGWNELCDAIVYIDTPREQRLSRVQSRGWSAAELERREASQLSLAEKKQRSDILIDNSGTVESAATTLWNWLRERFPQLTGSSSKVHVSS